MVDVVLAMGIVTLIAFLMFFIGVPILLIFGTWAVAFHLLVPVFGITNISISAFQVTQSFSFAAIPLFIFTGDLIYMTGIADDLFDLSRSTTGWLPGSSGNTALTTSALFSAITGSNAATTATVGKGLFPSLEEEGYDDRYAAATIAAGGTVGGMIPPSLLLIIYGVTFGVSVTNLFIAGTIPGLLMISSLIVLNIYVSKREGYGVTADYSFNAREAVASAWKAKIALGTIAVLFGGIFTGTFIPSEAASFAILYIVVAGLATRQLTEGRQFIQPLLNSLLIYGAIIPMIILSLVVQQGLSFLGLQDLISSTIIGLQNEWLMIAAMVVVMLISGSVLASVPNLVLTAPLLAGAAAMLGMDPLTWGIVFMMSDMIGFITPPYGLNLYVISGITGIDYMSVAKAAIPHLIALIIIWLLIFIFPEINVLSPAPG